MTSVYLCQTSHDRAMLYAVACLTLCSSVVFQCTKTIVKKQGIGGRMKRLLSIRFANSKAFLFTYFDWKATPNNGTEPRSNVCLQLRQQTHVPQRNCCPYNAEHGF